MTLAAMRSTGQVVWSGPRAEFVCCSSHNLDWGLDFGFLGRQHRGEVPFLSHHIQTSVASIFYLWSFQPWSLDNIIFAKFLHCFLFSLFSMGISHSVWPPLNWGGWCVPPPGRGSADCLECFCKEHFSSPPLIYLFNHLHQGRLTYITLYFGL